MRTWSKRSLDAMRGIHPDLRRVLDRALTESPVDFIVIEGLRTRERQAEMVRTGKSRTMNSRHLTGHAVDLWPIDPETGKAADGRDDRALWRLYGLLAPAVKAAAAAEGVALVWGGDWTSFRDGPHFELERHTYPADLDMASKGRASPTESKTVQAATAGGLATAATAGTAIVEAVADADPTTALVICGFAAVALIAFAVVFRERLRAWAKGLR